jgi:hypothetical protein
MKTERLALKAPLVLSWRGSSSLPGALLAIPGVALTSRSAGGSLEITKALTGGEAHTILDAYPITERTAGWRAIWRQHFECWIELSAEALALWLGQALVFREMYPLLYVIPPLDPSAESMILFERMPEDMAPKRAAALQIALRQAPEANDWSLVNSLLPLIGRFQVKECLPSLLTWAEDNRRAAALVDENLQRNVFRCLASFSDERTIPALRRGLAVKNVADVCFSALAAAGMHLDTDALVRVTKHFAADADADYLMTLYMRFLDGSKKYRGTELPALLTIQEITRQSRVTPKQAAMVSRLLETGFTQVAHLGRPPTRLEMSKVATATMQDLKLGPRAPAPPQV